MASPAFATDSGVKVEEGEGQVRVRWPTSDEEHGSMIFSMDSAHPLIESIGISAKDEPPHTIAEALNPVTLLTVGSRDMENPAGWNAFFDNPPKRPHETFLVTLGKRELNVTTEGTHTTVSVAEVSAGAFLGDLRFTFYRNSPLILAEMVVTTQEDGRSIVYDSGLAFAKPEARSIVWNDTEEKLQRVKPDPAFQATPLKVAGRAIAAEGSEGSIGVFPPPHRYFYPQDEAYNLQFVWHGQNYQNLVAGYGIGIRQSLDGDKRYVPWFNAPPRTQQHLGVFYLISRKGGQQALEAIGKYTRGDRYKKIPGYLTFTSHYHIEHTKKFLAQQRAQNTNGIPKGLEEPGFVKTFKARGVNIVHLAEFHNKKTLTLISDERLPQLKAMFSECERLSDDDLLILPGEEANVHLGGHWMSLFPKPVYWVLNRGGETPLSEQVEGYGAVYHVGSSDDVLHLMEAENGLMWTAHARIKSSRGFPDEYKDEAFSYSGHFLGAAWKAMPADLSRPTLGWRVLDLMDDMANWGVRKQIVGEADLFRMEPDFETYAHMNINYLRLDRLPKFQTGWQSVLDTLRGGHFFTTTGEVLIPEFRVGNKGSGEILNISDNSAPLLEADLEWTFPLAFAEVISGDGKNVYRQRIALTDMESFGTRKLQVPLDLKGRIWVRFEVWDIAANGAFTQPIWLETAPAEEER